MNYHQYVKLPITTRKRLGATFTLMIFFTLFLIIIGAGLYYLMGTFSGGKQLMNSNDAGCIATAQALFAVSIPPGTGANQISHTDANGNLDIIPQQFQSCGVDQYGNSPVGQVTLDGNGNPIDSNGTPIYYNLSAYNQACGVTLVSCLKAANLVSAANGNANALINAGTAIANANALVVDLNNFSNALALAMLQSPKLENAFANIASQNGLNNLPNQLFGNQPATTMLSKSLQLGCQLTARGASNVYLPPSFTSQFTSTDQQAWLKLIQSGTPAQVQEPQGVATPMLIAAGTGINLSQITSNGTPVGLQGTITAAPFDVGESGHLIVPPTNTVVDSNFVITAPGLNFTGNLSILANGQYNLSSSDTNSMNTLANMAGNGQTITITNPNGGGFSNNWTFSIKGPSPGGSLQLTPVANNNDNGIIYPHYSNPITFPFNAIRVMSQSQASGGSNLNLSTLSAALAGTLQEYQISVPSGYVRIMNGPDFAAAIAGNIPGGYSNLPINSSTNLAFDADYKSLGAKYDSIFDQFSQYNPNGADYLIVGTDTHNTTLQTVDDYIIKTGDLSTAFETGDQDQSVPQLVPPPDHNYGDIIDNEVFDSTYPRPPLDNSQNTISQSTSGAANISAMPFILSSQDSNTTLAWEFHIFRMWAEYNMSAGDPGPKDGLGRLFSKDPLPSCYQQYQANPSMFKQEEELEGKTAPEIFYAGQASSKYYDPKYYAKHGGGASFVLPDGRACGSGNQRMTLGDALAIRGGYLINDGPENYQPGAPAWASDIIPVVCANYRFPYLPAGLNGYKSNFTAIEYAKAQVNCIFGGWGIMDGQNPPLPPSAPGYVYLPMSRPVAGTSQIVLGGNGQPTITSSGMKDFIGPPSGGFSSYSGGYSASGWGCIPSPTANPYFTSNGNRYLTHHAWFNSDPAGSPNSVNSFEQLSTPMQLAYNIDVLLNNGKFVVDNGLNANFKTIMDNLLQTVQLMNPSANYTMTDVINALCSTPVDAPAGSPAASGNLDLGSIWYLSVANSGPSNGKLQLTVNLPVGDQGGAADGPSNSIIQYYTTFPITGGWVAPNKKALSAEEDPKSLVDTALFNGDRGDCDVHDAPYRGIAAYYPANGDYHGDSIYAEDMMQWWPSSGAATGSGNHGDLIFYESAGPSMQFSSIN